MQSKPNAESVGASAAHTAKGARVYGYAVKLGHFHRNEPSRQVTLDIRRLPARLARVRLLSPGEDTYAPRAGIHVCGANHEVEVFTGAHTYNDEFPTARQILDRLAPTIIGAKVSHEASSGLTKSRFFQREKR